MSAYIALIHKDDDSDYGVSFPDFPGCVTGGSALDEARTMAAEALAFHIEGMKEDGDPIPAPSDLATVMREREHQNAVAFLVDVTVPQSKTVRVNITLSEEQLKSFDEFAELEGYSRSGLIVKATRAFTEFLHNANEHTVLHRPTNAIWRYDNDGNIALVSPHKFDQAYLDDLEEGVRHKLNEDRRRMSLGRWTVGPSSISR